jgi:hypothetical protein
MIMSMNNMPDQGIPLRRMTRHELLARKAELDAVLEVLWANSYDSVCSELGQISYLLDDRRVV